uniref:Type I polyketide synthase n=1 Tax=Gambierdiscus excentricus TaxID=986170 RepID=A0A1S6K7Y4_9DINO|nr:type I polyketide synthase [Gambierdiscus excentricus]
MRWPPLPAMTDVVPVEDGGELQELPDAKPLEGALVQIFGMEGETAKCISVKEEEAEAEEVEVDGLAGRVVAWYEPEQKYIVETFDGLLAGVPEDKVRQYVPPSPEEGGFDVTWPSGADATAEFGEMIVGELASKGYCLIQTFMSEKDRAEAMEAAFGEGETRFYRMKQEIEGAYMGHDNLTKLGAMTHDSVEDEADVTNTLEACNRQLSTLGLLLTPLAPANLGFACHSRLNAMIRMSIEKGEEEDLPIESIMDDEDSSEWSANIEGWLRYQQRRKLSMLHMISNQGGDIWFYPKPGFGPKSIHIPISQNKILLFRHDLMDYSYQVVGPSLALQTWILNDPPKYQQIHEMQVNLGAPGLLGEVVVNPGPAVPDGPKASVMALTVRLPGEAWNPSQYWLMYCSGSDTCSQWPYNRWDTEPYYQEGVDSTLTGKAYTCHGGFISQEMITQFDNEFFGIDHTEARSMLPGQRVALEVGYQCLVAAGFTRQSLQGRRMGVWFGDVGPDWHSFQTEWGRFNWDINPALMGTSMNNSVTAGRLAHVFDLRGPVSSYDTACSASLVAMNAAHLLMFDQDPPRKDNAEALVQGVNTLLGPGSFIGNCMATMLSHQGRSFTFNRSADGYQRGEGCGAIYIKLFQGNKKEEEERVCALIGTATNQDGRSASLTAPNGPAQQAVIKKSMAFAGINPNTVSIAECHGTGTALGDPIEVGALMAVMHQREFPILKTSAKSNIAHLEAGAGIAGLTKCIMMINMATAPPNCHLNIINPHLTTEGYPVYFDTEQVNTGFSSLYCGVSSFGFGGTNSRADVYGYASKGHKAVIKFYLPKPNPPRVQPIGQDVFICGTWTGWSEYEAMEGGRNDTYQCAIVLGETRVEKFYLSCSEDTYESIHPLVDDAGQSEQIVGPDFDGSKDLVWMIDGRKDGSPPGTIYEITFSWSPEKKTISWEKAESTGELKVLGYDFEHKFYLTGSWRRWEGYQEMRKVDDDTYEGAFKVGYRFSEEFQIVRDADPKQAIYPCKPKCMSTSLPLCGPDDQGKGKNWLVKGKQHQVITVRVKYVNAKAKVTVITPTDEKFWESWEGWALQNTQTFYVTGTFNGGRCSPMVPVESEQGVHKYLLTLNADGTASFQILVNEDRELVLHPDEGLALMGPSAEGANAWYMEGPSNAKYEVKLDLLQADRTKMVTWEPAPSTNALT